MVVFEDMTLPILCTAAVCYHSSRNARRHISEPTMFPSTPCSSLTTRGLFCLRLRLRKLERAVAVAVSGILRGSRGGLQGKFQENL